MELYAPDGVAVILTLLRKRLPSNVHVVSRLPDDLPDYCPLVLVRRTGGQSRAPQYWDDLLVQVQVFAGGPGVQDPSHDAYLLSDQVRRVLWEAVLHQHVTEHGWLIDMRESSAPEEYPDSDIPLFSRFIAVYDLRARRPYGVG